MNTPTSRSLRCHLPALLLASTIVGGCARAAETAADRQAEEIAIAMQIGAPLPDAVDTRTIWSAASQVPYSHRLDIDAIDQWYADLPNRFECDQVEREVPAAGRVGWAMSCYVDEGSFWLAITVATRESGGSAITVVDVRHEKRRA